MKICSNCAASNLDKADFCSECDSKLLSESARSRITMQMPKKRIKLAAPAAKASALRDNRNITSYDLAHALEKKFYDKNTGHKRADIMFILDCTESMQGEINAIRDTILSFAYTLESNGVQARVGLIAFRDRLINEEHSVLSFGGQPFTDDPAAFRKEVMKLVAIGGGDEPESSLDAILLALRQPFDQKAKKILVLVTDAPPHVPDKEAKSVNDVTDAIKAAGIEQMYLIIPVQATQNQIYFKLCQNTRGVAFDLGTGDDFRSRAEDFKRTLMSLGKTISAVTV